MNGFETGVYKIYSRAQMSDLSGIYKSEAAFLDAIRREPPGSYSVSLVFGGNDYEDWGDVINRGNGVLTVNRHTKEYVPAR
jgi:hypothetical protein